MARSARMHERIDKALTVVDVAREYGVQPKTVYAWIRKGEIRALRLPGGDYRFRREHLDAFDRCRDTSSSARTTDSALEAAFGSSTGPTSAPGVVDPFQRGRLSVVRPRS